jgi:hypothetical protein
MFGKEVRDVTEDLSRLKVKRLIGTEPFTQNGKPADFSIVDFWQWASSDLVVNVMRGLLAEYVVAQALDLADEVRDPWQPYDLKTKAGLTLEVKSGAYIQSWWQRALSSICFSIGETRSWSADTNEFSPTAQRQAQAYVFALLAHRDKSTVDPRELSQWEFYLVPTSALLERVGKRKSLSFKALLDLNPRHAGFQELPNAIRELEANILGRAQKVADD